MRDYFAFDFLIHSYGTLVPEKSESDEAMMDTLGKVPEQIILSQHTIRKWCQSCSFFRS